MITVVSNFLKYICIFSEYFQGIPEYPEVSEKQEAKAHLFCLLSIPAFLSRIFSGDQKMIIKLTISMFKRVKQVFFLIQSNITVHIIKKV